MNDILPVSAGKAPAVFLAAPHAGPIHSGAARAIYQAAIGDGSPIQIVGVGQANSSLLAFNFNILLASALDARDAGEVTHFAMLHADIEPIPELDEAGMVTVGWVDILCREMAASGADVVSAVVPIKEVSGNPRTSTAIFDDANPWTPKQFLYVANKEELPTTFTNLQVCQPGEHLGINTGCMLIDLRRPWWDDFAFEIRDRIVKGPNGKRHAQVRPEDWEMSRHVQSHGGVVAATWAVKLSHHGSMAWNNF